MNDLKFAFRQLLKNPGFTAVAVLSLALGIGVSTAVFCLLNGVLLRSLPVRDAHELRVLRWTGWNVSPHLGTVSGGYYDDASKQSFCDAFNYPLFASLQEGCGALADVCGYAPLRKVTVRGNGTASIADGCMVSDDFFSTLRVTPLIGRLPSGVDDVDEASSATVISYALWEREFGLDPEALGKSLRINGHAFTVIGVLPHGFAGVIPEMHMAFYVPLSAQLLLKPSFSTTATDVWWVQLLARVKPATRDAQLQAALDVVFARHAGDLMQKPAVLIEKGQAGHSYARNLYRRPLLLLLGVVGVVILVACANLAGLSLARGAAREHEYAVRAAIGARRWQLIRQSLAESLVLAGLGAGLGVLLAVWCKGFIARLLAGSPEGLQFDTALDWRVLGFATAIALVTALLSGLLPATRAGRANARAGLRSRGSHGSPRLRVGRVLVVAQVALTLLLLAGGGLYGRSLLNLVHIDPGFSMDNVLLFHLDPRSVESSDAARATFYERVQESLVRIPGVKSATLSQHALLGGWMSGGRFFTLPGQPTTGELKPQAHRLTVSETFFDTMNIAIFRGRGLRATDRAGSPKVVIVNETFAKKFLSERDPLGVSMKIGDSEWQIVGVCGDAKYRSIKDDIPPTVYFSFRQDNIGSAFFAVRSVLPPLSIVTAARRAVSGVDPNVPLDGVTTQRQQFDQNISQELLFASLCGALALLAVFLSCIGLYGLMAYNVARRTGEIGIRLALGATRWRIVEPILREAVLLTVIGAAIGVPVALGLTRFIKSQLYGVAPTDPVTLVGAVIVLLAVATLAAWIPSRRAARVDPMVALRSE